MAEPHPWRLDQQRLPVEDLRWAQDTIGIRGSAVRSGGGFGAGPLRVGGLGFGVLPSSLGVVLGGFGVPQIKLGPLGVGGVWFYKVQLLCPTELWEWEWLGIPVLCWDQGFRDGTYLVEALKEMLEGRLQPSDLPTFRVVLCLSGGGDVRVCFVCAQGRGRSWGFLGG